MANTIIELNWFGPFKWHDKNGFSIIEQNESKECGLYIWAVKNEDSYIIYYVCETGRSFKDRFTEHISNYL